MWTKFWTFGIQSHLKRKQLQLFSVVVVVVVVVVSLKLFISAGTMKYSLFSHQKIILSCADHIPRLSEPLLNVTHPQ